MGKELTICSPKLVEMLVNESERLGVDHSILIERLLEQSIASRMAVQHGYHDALNELLTEIMATRSEVIDELKKTTLKGKTAIFENYNESGVGVVVQRLDLGNDRTQFYNRQFSIMLNHPKTSKVIKLTPYYSLGIMMSINFAVFSLRSGKPVTLHAKDYRIAELDSKPKIKEEILKHILTLELDGI